MPLRHESCGGELKKALKLGKTYKCDRCGEKIDMLVSVHPMARRPGFQALSNKLPSLDDRDARAPHPNTTVYKPRRVRHKE